MARENAALMGLCLCLSAGGLAVWPGVAHGTDARGGERRDTGRVFARLDRNRDGIIDFDEMRRARDRWVARVDTDRDGRISRAEFLSAPPRGEGGRVSPLHRARRAKVFARIDMNRDGYIDAAEREASLRRWFARRDLDGNGRLSFAEVEAARKRWLAWRGEEPVKPAQRGATGKTDRKRPRGIARFDRNADGAVSFAELSAARAGRMEAIDRDRDGRVSYDEFVNRGDDAARSGGAGSGRTSGRRARWRARLFVRIDRNRDGYITPEEHAHALRNWFARMDSDGDGLISAQEFAAARARWRARRRALREAE